MSDHITIGDIEPRVQYSGDGMQTTFTYPFPIFNDNDLEVYLGTALQISGYTISGAGNSAGGTVTLNSPAGTGVLVTLRRQLAIERTTDFQESGEFRAKVINDELDREVAMIQQVNDGLERTLHLQAFDPSVSLELPDKATRSNMYLAFDANGKPIASDAKGPPGEQGIQGSDGRTSNLSVDSFTDGIDFTAGTTTVLIASSDPGSKNNISISFDGIHQHRDTFSITGQLVTFSSPIPVGVINVEFTLGSTASIGTPSDATVTSAKLVDGSVTNNKIVSNAVTLNKLANGTTGNLISYDTLGNPVAVATGTAGQALLSQGAGLPPVMGNITEVGGKPPANIITLTTSGNYTPTPGTTRIKVKVIGGGGGGGASTGDTMAGMQGGAGAYAEKTYEVTDLTFPLAYTIGAKGIAVAGDLPPINRSIYK